MSGSTPLRPAAELAEKNRTRYPNESAEYRRARQALLAEEIELRRHIERVAEQRRALPPGGEVTKNYRFEGERGPVSFADLFGDKQSLVIYSYMFGPAREQPCPMCTSFMSTWEAKLPDVEQRIAFVFVARSPIARTRASTACVTVGTRARRRARRRSSRTRRCPRPCEDARSPSTRGSDDPRSCPPGRSSRGTRPPCASRARRPHRQ